MFNFFTAAPVGLPAQLTLRADAMPASFPYLCDLTSSSPENTTYPVTSGGNQLPSPSAGTNSKPMKNKSLIILLAFSLFLAVLSLASQRSLANFCDGLLPYTVGSIQSVDDITDVEAPGIYLDGVNRRVSFYDFEPFIMPEEEFLFLRILLTEKDYRRSLSEMAARIGKSPKDLIDSLNKIFRQLDPQFSGLQVFDGSVHWRI